MTSQKTHVADVANRQVQTEERVSALEAEVDTLKRSHREGFERLESRQSAAENRLVTAESEIRREVDDVCSRVTAELRNLQSKEIEDLKQKMLREMTKMPTPIDASPRTPLRPEAPSFLPLAVGATLSPLAAGEGGAGPGGEGVTKSVQRAPPYDGRSAWEAYRTQFEMLARINGWSEVEKATYLAVSLKGPALTVLSNIPQDDLYNYSLLVTALETRFGSSHQAELHRIKLKNRTRKKEESLAELSEEVERLARLAYPDAPSGMLELLAKDQFIDAITDGEMRLQLRQSHPKGLREALQTALELEAFQLANQQRVKPVRGAAIDNGSDPAEKPPSKTVNVSCDEIKHCVQKCIENCLQQGQTYQRRSPGRHPRRRRAIKGNCWSCGRPGHMQKDCTQSEKQPAQPASPQPSNQQGNDN